MKLEISLGKIDHKVVDHKLCSEILTIKEKKKKKGSIIGYIIWFCQQINICSCSEGLKLFLKLRCEV